MTLIILGNTLFESSLLCQIYGITPQMFVGEAPNLVELLPRFFFVAEQKLLRISPGNLSVRKKHGFLCFRLGFSLPSIGPPLKPGLALDGSGHRLVQLGRGRCGAGRAAGRQGFVFRTKKRHFVFGYTSIWSFKKGYSRNFPTFDGDHFHQK